MKPKIVGYWVVQVTKGMELLKYGKDGDLIFPHKYPSQALKQIAS
jgi:hypothetical protein